MRRALLALAAIPAFYLVAALIGSLIPVNQHWTEAEAGIPIYIADNGIHADIIMPARVGQLDWTPIVPKSDFAAADAEAQWVAFGAGEERVYLQTPRWRDIRLATIWSALAGGRRVMHVEWVRDPRYAARVVRLRPEEYRRLWASVRADFARDRDGKVQHIDHPGYGPADTFYWARGKTSAIHTCNSWAAQKLRLAGIKTSLWPPFVQGLVWRYRKADQST